MPQLLGLDHGRTPERQATADIPEQNRSEREKGLRGRLHVRRKRRRGRPAAARLIQFEQIAELLPGSVKLADLEQRHAECAIADQPLRRITLAISSHQKLFADLSGLFKFIPVNVEAYDAIENHRGLRRAFEFMAQ